jgi:uncharacterized integral membrane protein
MKARTIVLLILVVLAAVIIIQNSRMDTIRLLFWAVYGPKFILVVLVFFIGFAAGLLFGRRGRRKTVKPPDPPAKPPAQTP